jgi:hypothetical protein
MVSYMQLRACLCVCVCVRACVRVPEEVSRGISGEPVMVTLRTPPWV